MLNVQCCDVLDRSIYTFCTYGFPFIYGYIHLLCHGKEKQATKKPHQNHASLRSIKFVQAIESIVVPT